MSLLPTEKTRPATDLSAFNILLWGPPKIGKSEFASRFPGVLMLAFEPGLSSIPCYKVDVDSWPTFLAVCAELAEKKHGFRHVCIDTLDVAHAYCRAHVLEKLGVQHESDVAYGKAYGLIQNEFGRVLGKLGHLGLGLIMTSHSTVIEIPTRTGTIQRSVPTLPEKARKLVVGMCDLSLFADLEATVGADGKPDQRRVIRTKPHLAYEAGDRTARLPDPLPLNFDAFAQAFDQAVKAQGPGGAAPSKNASPSATTRETTTGPTPQPAAKPKTNP